MSFLSSKNIQNWKHLRFCRNHENVKIVVNQLADAMRRSQSAAHRIKAQMWVLRCSSCVVYVGLHMKPNHKFHVLFQHDSPEFEFVAVPDNFGPHSSSQGLTLTQNNPSTSDDNIKSVKPSGSSHENTSTGTLFYSFEPDTVLSESNQIVSPSSSDTFYDAGTFWCFLKMWKLLSIWGNVCWPLQMTWNFVKLCFLKSYKIVSGDESVDWTTYTVQSKPFYIRGRRSSNKEN